MKLSERNFEPEFTFNTSRSSGAGGQHVNKTETKVELIFDVNTSQVLSDKEKQKILEKLAGSINNSGELRVTSSESRSQIGNKEKAVRKFYALLEKALKKEKRRIPTAMPEVIKEEIKKNKRLHSEKKKGRSYNTRNLM